MTITRKINSVIFGTMTLIVIILAFLIYYPVTSYIENIFSNYETLRSHNLMREIDRFLYERYVDVQTYGGREQLKLLLKSKLTSEDVNVVYRQFKELQYINGVWDDLGVVAPNGQVILSSDPRYHNVNILGDSNHIIEAKIFEKALMGEVAYSDAFRSKITDQPTIVFMAPIRDKFYGGEILGVMMGYLNWSVILENLESITNAGVHLLNGDGLEIGSNFFERNEFLFRASFEDLELDKNREEGIRFEHALDPHTGESVFNSYAYEQGYLDYKGNNWTLVLETLPAFIASPAKRAAINIVLIFILAAIIGMAFIWIFLNRKIITPIVSMSRVVHGIGSGKELIEMPVSKLDDEIRELAIGFNAMIGRLREVYTNLESTIAQKTQSLEEKIKIMKSQGAELQDANRAILNLIEDTQAEKDNAERERDRTITIIQGISDGVFVIDEIGKIIIFNTASSLITGYAPEEVLNKNYKDVLKFVLEKDKTPNYQFIEDALKTGTTKKMTNHSMFIRKDGSLVSVADSAAPLKDKNSKVIGCVVVFRDVTMEREIDRAKSEFVSLSSHQLRTPLSTIGWYAELLLSGDVGKLNKEQKRYVNEIYHGNERMVDLVNALLDVSRLELGIFGIMLEPINWGDIAIIVINELKPKIKEKHIKFQEKYDGDLSAQFDHRMASIIIQNILSNAIKYTPAKGAVDLSINRQNEDILITIKDSGYGIPKSVQGKIFTKLFRADNAREKESDGTGLGLYIVKSIVDKSGGEIRFESAENKGTTFYVRIPAVVKVKKSDQN